MVVLERVQVGMQRVWCPVNGGKTGKRWDLSSVTAD